MLLPDLHPKPKLMEAQRPRDHHAATAKFLHAVSVQTTVADWTWNSNFLRSLQRRGLSFCIGSVATRTASFCAASGVPFLAVGEKTKKCDPIINSSPDRLQAANGP